MNSDKTSDLTVHTSAIPMKGLEENNASPKVPSETNIIATELSAETQLTLEILQNLLEPCDRATYGQKLKEAAERLGVSVRTVQRLVKNWEQDGLVGISETSRVDRGKYGIVKFWEDFMIKTYKEGNKGSKRMTPKQVALRVQAQTSPGIEAAKL
jgi:putative transposase